MIHGQLKTTIPPGDIVKTGTVFVERTGQLWRKWSLALARTLTLMTR